MTVLIANIILVNSNLCYIVNILTQNTASVCQNLKVAFTFTNNKKDVCPAYYITYFVTIYIAVNFSKKKIVSAAHTLRFLTFQCHGLV